MRIAVITTSYPARTEDPSGHFVRTEVRWLLRDGHRVTVFLPNCPDRLDEPGLAFCPLPHLGLFGWPGATTRLLEHPARLLGLLPFVALGRRRLARLGPFDALVAHWLLPAFWPIACDFVGKTTVVCHGSDVGLLERLPRRLKFRVLRALGRDNVTVRAVSTDLQRRLATLANLHGLPNLRIRVEPSPIELPRLGSPGELRQMLGLEGSPVVVIVGRVVKDKRIEVAIEAVELAFAQLGLARQGTLLVLGDGPERKRLMLRHPGVRWLGQLPRLDTLRHIGAADLLVSASLLEGAPTVVREARALGTPVVAAATTDLQDAATRDPDLTVVPNFPALPDRRATDAIGVVLQRRMH